MISYQLPNGRTVQLSIDQVLYLRTEDVHYLVASGAGEEINNPFQGSALHELSSGKKDLTEMDGYEPGIQLSELCAEDQAELSSVAGMGAIFDDGDYLGDFED